MLFKTWSGRIGFNSLISIPIGFELATEHRDIKVNSDSVGVENGELVQFGISGNIYYELILEIFDGKPTFIPYLKGTYIAPEPTSITLQPINN